MASSKRVLPAYVRTAHTVAVVVDPDAGVSLEDSRANQIAQKDVETAFANWGRYLTVIGSEDADLIVVVRKGGKHLVEETVSDPRQNGRAGVINPSNDGVGVGVQHGSQPPLSGAAQGARGGTGDAHPATEIGPMYDTFTVYDGKAQHPLDGAPAWRLISRDCLKSHAVPAVDEFRKAVAEADKAAAHKP